MKAGNGKRYIMISGDDEGNSYHELFYGFSPCKDAIEQCTALCRPARQSYNQEFKAYGGLDLCFDATVGTITVHNL